MRKLDDDEIEAIRSEARYCEQAQSWCPSATRSAYYGEVAAVADAAEALAAADDRNQPEAYTECKTALAAAIAEAEAEADRLAKLVAQAQLDGLTTIRDLYEAMKDRGYGFDARREGVQFDESTHVVKGWALARHWADRCETAEVERKVSVGTMRVIAALDLLVTGESDGDGDIVDAAIEALETLEIEWAENEAEEAAA